MNEGAAGPKRGTPRARAKYPIPTFLQERPSRRRKTNMVSKGVETETRVPTYFLSYPYAAGFKTQSTQTDDLPSFPEQADDLARQTTIRTDDFESPILPRLSRRTSGVAFDIPTTSPSSVREDTLGTGNP